MDEKSNVVDLSGTPVSLPGLPEGQPKEPITLKVRVVAVPTVVSMDKCSCGSQVVSNDQGLVRLLMADGRAQGGHCSDCGQPLILERDMDMVKVIKPGVEMNRAMRRAQAAKKST